MPEEIFRSGQLVMSGSPVPYQEQAAAWGDYLTNDILMVLAVFLVLLNLLDYFKILPTILDCYSRTRASSELEHSVSTSRIRNTTALVLAVPFCLIVDRFGIYSPDLLESVNPLWQAPVIFGVLAAFLFVRAIFRFFFGPKMRGETRSTIINLLYTYFIGMASLMIVTTGIIALFNISEVAACGILTWEIFIFYFFFVVRDLQILSQHFSGLSTILYLCGLELMPAAVLVASAVLL